MSSLTVEEDQRWVPTHVQVTVLRGRGLRGKGKHGTSDVYTIIQLGKEKYSTGVAEKTTEPEWKEECSFELQPGVLETGSPAGSNELVLTVMHRALMGLDVFLGQAVVRLDEVFHHGRCVKNEWYRLNSKTGKKEKERGDIQVTVQFTRNNLTASMYDLVMKDKSISTFGKLKERMRGKRRSSDEDSSSAVLPGGYGSLCRMRQRLPSDGGGEEDYEDDEGGEARRSKMRTFFLRGKLRKSSDTRSSTSLGSESSESSSRGGSLSPTAGISVVVSDLSNSPSNSSNLTADNSPEHTGNTSPKSSSSLRCEFGDEPGEITIAVPPPSVCVNGSHAYSVQPLDPGSGKPAGSLGLGLLQKTLPLSMSLQNLSPRASTDPLHKGPVGDGRRWSFDKPGEEEKAAIAAALEQSGPMMGDEEEAAAEEERLGPKTSSSTSSSLVVEGKKQKRNLFSHGRSESGGRGQSQAKDESEQAPATADEKHRGWFGSKDSHSKPSLVVSPKLEPSTDPHPPPSTPPPYRHPPVDPASPLHHTNPFSQSTPPPFSPCNPFFSLLQHNPFYEDMLKPPSLPPLPYLSSARPPIAQLFPRVSNPDPNESVASEAGAGPRAEKRPLPPTPSEGETPLSERPANPFMSAGELDSEWDESFEAFAAGRLQSPEDVTSCCTTQQHTTTNTNGMSPPETHTRETANTNSRHSDEFAQFLETIPEHTGFDGNTNPPTPAACAETNHANADDLTNTNNDPSSSSPDPGSSSGLGSSAEEDLFSCISSYSDKISGSSSANSPKPAACTETNHANTNDLTNANNDPSSSSPDPGSSSGLGSSAEEDLFSCISSYSDKFSSSSEEPEAQNLKKDSPVVKEESEEDVCNLSLVDQCTVIQRRHEDEFMLAVAHSTPEDPELQPKPSMSLQSDTGESNTSPEVPTDAMPTQSPDIELCPTLHVITSSPDVTQTSPELNPNPKETSSPIPFGLDLLNVSRIANGPPSHDLDRSDQSSDASLVRSLYVSADSQDYQSCGGSEEDSTLHSANSTLCGEIQTTAGEFERSFALTAAASMENLAASKCPQPTLLLRSQSEGSLTPALDEQHLFPLPPSFGSDPGAVQESPPGRHLPSFLTSSAPSLTPVAIRSSLPLLLAVPVGAARAAAARDNQEQEQEQERAANQENSPHPVKPLTTAMLAEERRTEGRSVLATGLEKLKSTIHPGRSSSQSSEQEADKRKSVTEGAGSYYHLNHSELVALLVQREAELERQKAEYERQKVLLAKREVELKKLKPQVRDLEDYIDTLLVRIMEQKPTLLQVRSKLK